MQRILDAWITAERGRFILFLPVFMAAGVLVYFAGTSEPSAATALVPAGVSLIGLAFAWRFPLARAVFFGVAFAAGGFADAWWVTARAPPWDALPRGATVAVGTVGLVEALPQGRRVVLTRPSLDGAEPLDRDLRIRLRNSDRSPVSVGDVVSVRALVQQPSQPDVPGGWDTQREAFFAGLDGYGFAIGPSHVLTAAPLHWWYGVRELASARIAAVLPGARGAIASTLLTGLGSAIPPDDRAAFQDSGLAHLLAVAGLHIGIVMGLVFGIVRLGVSASEYVALRWSARRVASLASLAAGIVYLALTGAHLPILRSFAMASVFTLGVLTGRRALSLRSLALAAVLLMLWSPAELVGVSFQMSFGAVLALVACAEVLSPRLAALRSRRWWGTPALYVLGLALTSLIAGTASLPFAAYHFGRATLYYVPANMLAVPLTAFWVLPWGVAALLLMPLGLERLALVPMGAGIDGLLRIAHTVAAWPGATREVGQIHPAALALVGFGMAWLGLWRTRLRLLGLAPILLGLAVPLVSASPDIILGPGPDVIAARIGEAVFLERSRRASPFEADAPAKAWGLDRAEDFPAHGAAAGGAVTCDPSACTMRIAARSAILVRDAASLPCGPDLLVSLETLRGACSGMPVADRGLVRRSGAVAVRLTDGRPRFLTDRDVRGDRPWVIRARVLLPPAATE